MASEATGRISHIAEMINNEEVENHPADGHPDSTANDSSQESIGKGFGGNHFSNLVFIHSHRPSWLRTASSLADTLMEMLVTILSTETSVIIPRNPYTQVTKEDMSRSCAGHAYR